MRESSFVVAAVLGLTASLATAAERPVPASFPIEAAPADPNAAKIVFIAGSNFYKPGEHDYIAGSTVLANLLRQTPGVAPVFALAGC
jgi:hypothetical protein